MNSARGGIAAPYRRLLGALLYAALVVIAATLAATSQPWLGLHLGYSAGSKAAQVQVAEGPAAALPRGMMLTALAAPGAAPVELREADLTPEPDGSFGRYAEFHEFLQRQDRLARLMHEPELRLIDADGQEHRLRPGDHRPLRSLPFEFWLQIMVGLLAWLIATGVWAFRPGEASARYLLLSAWGVLTFAPAAAVYSTRELALPMPLFRLLSELNCLGAFVFCSALIALLWYYPRRLGRAPLGPVLVAGYVAWVLAQAAGAFETIPVGRHAPIMLGFLSTFILAGAQWRNTRSDPVARASLLWFLLSWLLGSGAFVMLTVVPQMFGVDTANLQAYAFLLFLLIYVGIALGILRFRLFDLGDWWFRIWTLFIAGALVIAADLLLVLWFGFEPTLAASLALAVIGWAYFPARQWLLERLVRRPRPDVEALLGRLLDTAEPDPRELWRRSLSELFQPLQMEMAEPGRGGHRIGDDGISLRVDPGPGQPAFRLQYPASGRRLFSRQDLALVELLQRLIEKLMLRDRLVGEGAELERQRIAQDLHDDACAKLLTVACQTREPATEGRLREVLEDVRVVVHCLSGGAQRLQDLVPQWRSEAADRCEAAGVTLDWRSPDSLPECWLSPVLTANAARMLREALSNALRHAQPTRIAVRLQIAEGLLSFTVEHTGQLPESVGQRPGMGLRNLQRRASEVGGEFSLQQQGALIRAQWQLPLPQSLTSTAP